MSFYDEEDDDDQGFPKDALVWLEKRIIKIQNDIDEHRQRDSEYDQRIIPDLVEELKARTFEHKMRLRTMIDQEMRARRPSWRRKFLYRLSLTASA
jgi:hypothetical protein